MVSLEQDLFPGQGVDKPKIRQRLLQIHRPAQIPAEHRQIVLRQSGKALSQFFGMVFPRVPEDVHRFVIGQGQVEISDCVKRHTHS